MTNRDELIQALSALGYSVANYADSETEGGPVDQIGQESNGRRYTLKSIRLVLVKKEYEPEAVDVESIPIEDIPTEIPEETQP